MKKIFLLIAILFVAFAANGQDIPKVYELPEIKVTPASPDVLRIVCYIQEHNRVVIGADTAVMFNEFNGDYFIPRASKGAKKKTKKRFDPVRTPRILAEKCNLKYTTNNWQIDTLLSKADTSQLLSAIPFLKLPVDSLSIPKSVREAEDDFVYTVKGKSAPKEIWTKKGTKIGVKTDMLADSKNHKMSPFILKVLGYTMDINEAEFNVGFDNLRQTKHFCAEDVTHFSATLDVTARGRAFRKRLKLKSKEGIRLTSHYEIYVYDRAYLTVDEANEMLQQKLDPKKTAVVKPDYEL